MHSRSWAKCSGFPPAARPHQPTSSRAPRGPGNGTNREGSQRGEREAMSRSRARENCCSQGCCGAFHSHQRPKQKQKQPSVSFPMGFFHQEVDTLSSPAPCVGSGPKPEPSALAVGQTDTHPAAQTFPPCAAARAHGATWGPRRPVCTETKAFPAIPLLPPPFVDVLLSNFFLKANIWSPAGIPH